MTSVGPVGRVLKHNSGSYYIPLENLTAANKILAYTPGSGAGGSFTNGSFSQAAWALGTGSVGASPYTSSISAIGKGGLLRDMGRTVVSANRTFRKIQLVCSTVSTGGVGGPAAGGAANVDFLTGYIELSSGPGGSFGNAAAAPAAVAVYPGLM